VCLWSVAQAQPVWLVTWPRVSGPRCSYVEVYGDDITDLLEAKPIGAWRGVASKAVAEGLAAVTIGSKAELQQCAHLCHPACAPPPAWLAPPRPALSAAHSLEVVNRNASRARCASERRH
jgi:hypothetical protein